MSFVRDLRIAARSLARRKAAFASCVLALGAGIGVANLAGALAHIVLWRMPAGVYAPQDVYRARIHAGHLSGLTPGVSSPVFAMLRANTPDVDIAAFGSTQVDADDIAQRHMTVQLVTGTYFRVIGAHAFVGRLVDVADDQPAGSPVAVVSYDFWHNQLDGRRAVLGQVVRLNGHPFSVIGVAANHFDGIDGGQVDAWVPATSADQLGLPAVGNTSFQWLRVIARAPRGDMMTLGRILTRAVSQSQADRPVRVALVSLTAPSIADRSLQSDGALAARTFVMITCAIGLAMLLLPVASASLFLLLRSKARAGEMAVRLALGAPRSAIVGAVLAEAAILCGLAVLIGSQMTRLGAACLRLLPGPADQFYVDGAIAGWMIAVALLGVLLVAAVPAIDALRSSPLGVMRTMSTTSARAGRHQWLVLAQVCLAVVIVFSALTGLSALRAAVSVNAGLTLDELAAVSTGEPHSTAIVREPQFAGIAGVRGIAGLTGNPFHSTLQAQVRLSPQAAPTLMKYTIVDGDFFRVAGIRVLAGRDFGGATRGDPVVVVNQALARNFWGSERAAVGKCLIVDAATQCASVIGVAATTIYSSLTDRDVPAYYIPARDAPLSKHLPWTFLLRASSADSLPALLDRAASVARAINGSGAQTVQVKPLREFVIRELTEAKTKATVLSILGACAVFIAAVGLFAVQQYRTALRLREMAIRVAIGSSPVGAATMMAREMLLLVVGGIIVGCALSALIYHQLAEFVFSGGGASPAILLAAVVVVFLVVTVVAGFKPFRAILSISPGELLRID